MNQDHFSWLDHIVLASPNLQEGMDYVKEKVGCDPTYGGKHLQFGTHNALLKIGNLTYLEILAPDPENPKDHYRWMGVDLVDEPTITRFAIKTKSIDHHARLLSNFSPNHGRQQEGRRQKETGELLSWELTMPLPNPMVDSIPFLIDWQDSNHPAMNLENHCSIADFQLFSRKNGLQALFRQLDADFLVKYGEQRLMLSLNTPKGLVNI